jgi:accessory colonization factor AcfC
MDGNATDEVAQLRSNVHEFAHDYRAGTDAMRTSPDVLSRWARRAMSHGERTATSDVPWQPLLSRNIPGRPGIELS